MTGKRQVFNGAKTRRDCGFFASEGFRSALSQAMSRPRVTDAIIALLARLGPAYEEPCQRSFRSRIASARSGLLLCGPRNAARKGDDSLSCGTLAIEACASSLGGFGKELIFAGSFVDVPGHLPWS